MKDLTEFIIERGGQQFSGADFRDLLKPGVYVLLLQGRPVYIGMGNRLLRRVAGTHHKQHVFDDCDQILLYPCKSLEAAKELELELIGRLKPTSNENLKLAMMTKLLGNKRHPKQFQRS